MGLNGSGKRIFLVDNGRCQNCRRCAAQQACTVRALIRIDQDEPPFIDGHRCRGCALCIPACPHQAITFQYPSRPTKPA